MNPVIIESVCIKGAFQLIIILVFVDLDQSIVISVGGSGKLVAAIVRISEASD
jgi:hypothetical protein